MVVPLPTPYYQAVLDELAKSPTPHRDIHERMRDLFVAVDQRRIADIDRALKAMISADTSLEVPYQLISAEVFYETMFRLLQLGRTRQMCALIQWYGGFLKSLDFPQTTRVKGIRFDCARLPSSDSDDNFEGNNWAGMIDRIPDPLPTMTTAELERRREVVERTLVLAVPLFVTSPNPLRKKLRSRRVPLRQGLGDGLVRLFGLVLNIYHLLLERALDELARPGSVPGALSLTEIDTRWLELRKKTVPPPTKPTLLFSVLLPATTTEVAGSHAFLLDAFPPHRSRRFEFLVYSRAESAASAEPKPLRALDAVRHMTKRIDFFLREFGHKPLGNNGPAGIAPKDRRAFIAARKKPPSLRSDADLAAFACDLFVDQLTARPKRPARTLDEAWEAVILFLAHFFNTQTVHTGLNLAENATYIGTAFPRDVTGREFHDCGVYAMRMVNILLTLSACVAMLKDNKRLDFMIDFVILPLHVGLIVQPKGLQPLYVHNQQIVGLVKTVEQDFFNLWMKNADPKDPDPAGADDKRQKFLEDLAAQLFLLDVDLPLIRVGLRGVATPPTKRQLDRAYQRLVVVNYGKLFSGNLEKEGDDAFDFDTEFLEAQRVEIRWRDDHVVPLWNRTAHDLWHRTARNNVLPSGMAIRERYARALEAAVAGVEKRYVDVVLKQKNEVSSKLRKDSSRILGQPRPRVTFSQRLPGLVENLGPLQDIRAHINDVRSGGSVAPPPFSNPEFALVRQGD